ncbi:LppA family lipoprotein [Mycoplasma capricolum]|uniref:LppA family lipoprotein n=1 Tax=Mycoplasma capricolum TaxID=2095 RepID=UPI003DA5EF20
MRKISKLFLTFLPISSLSVFSLVSCTTNNKNNKPNEIPNSKKPNNNPGENKSELADKTSDEKSDSNKPNSDSHNSEQSKPSDDSNSNNSHNRDNSPSDKQPHTELPQDDQNNESLSDEKIFSDIDSLKKEIEFQYYTNYKNKDALTAWFEIKSRGKAIFKEIIFSRNTNILDKYQIEFDSQNHPEIIKEKGIISKVKIKFTNKNNKSKTIEFTFTGFQKINKKEEVWNKDSYIKPKEEINKNIKGLYPSLLAHMLLYTEDNKKYKSLEGSGNVINFEELANNRTDLFNVDFVLFGVGTKSLLFDYEEKFNKFYKEKIISAKFDDFSGELVLKVQIDNTEDHPEPLKDPLTTKEFVFKGFRKINIEKANENVLSLSLQPRLLKNIFNNKDLKNLVLELIKHKKLNEKIPLYDASGFNLQNELFKNLDLNIEDNQNKLYNSTQTLSLNINSKSENNKSIIGLKNNMSLYPFYSRVTKDSIQNIYLAINNKNDKNELTIEFDIYFNVYASTLSDLTDGAYTKEEKIKFKVEQSTIIDY